MAMTRAFAGLIAGIVLAACSTKDATAPIDKAPMPLIAQPSLTAGEWQAGTAVGSLFTPEGVSMGGYGFRVGPVGPRAGALGATRGRYERMLVKAVALENGHAAVVIVKLPMIFPTDLLRRLTIAELARRTGFDFGDALVLTATHTHSGPGRFWALPDGVGLFGLDDFEPAVVRELALSIADVVAKAWDRRAPARIGAIEVLRFDPENKITRDRRSANDNLWTDESDPNVYRDGETFKSKDGRLWIMRIEDGAGQPLAALFRVGIHGTHYFHQLFSEDAPGALERGVEAATGVPMAMLVQGVGGDVSPAGGDQGRDGGPIMEALARRMGRVVDAAWDGIETTDRGVLGAVHRRRNISRKVLGYRDDEFGVGQGEAFRPYVYGGFFCGEFGADPAADAGDPSTTLKDGSLGCVGIEEVEAVLSPPEQVELPPAELSTAVQSAIRIGDWRLVTFPGEPVSSLGSAMHTAAAAAGYDKLAVFGYSQTHLFYLTPEKDWWQGGYEAAQNIWGWRLGDFLVAQNVELLARLDRFGREPIWDGDPLVPLPREDEPSRLAAKPQAAAPSGVRLSASSTHALQPIAATWTGGDPWVDRAEVELEMETAAGWVAVASDAEHGWRQVVDLDAWPVRREVAWEPATSATPGRYRFRIRGHWLAEDGLQAYDLPSPAFAIEVAPILAVTAAHEGPALRMYPAFVSHPAAFEYWLPSEGLTRWQTAGFRLIDDAVGPADEAPIRGRGLAFEGVWQPGGQAVTAEVEWAADCACARWSPAAPPPPATTRLEIAAGKLAIGHWRNRDGLLINWP